MCIHTNKNIVFTNIYNTQNTCRNALDTWRTLTVRPCAVSAKSLTVWAAIQCTISRCSDVWGRNKPVLQLKSSEQMIPAPRSHFMTSSLLWHLPYFLLCIRPALKPKSCRSCGNFPCLFSWTRHFPNLLFASLFHPLTTGFRRHRCVR